MFYYYLVIYTEKRVSLTRVKNRLSGSRKKMFKKFLHNHLAKVFHKGPRWSRYWYWKIFKMDLIFIVCFQKASYISCGILCVQKWRILFLLSSRGCQKYFAAGPGVSLPKKKNPKTVFFKNTDHKIVPKVFLPFKRIDLSLSSVVVPSSLFIVTASPLTRLKVRAQVSRVSQSVSLCASPRPP